MESPMRLHKIYFITIIVCLLQLKQVRSQYHFFANHCDNEVGNYTEDSPYKTNLNTVLRKLQDEASTSFFDDYTVGNGIDQANGIYLCRGDLDNQQCHKCVEGATLGIGERCPVQKEAIIWYHECMVRYSNRSITNRMETDPSYYRRGNGNSSDPENYGKIVGKTAISLIKQAAYNTSRDGYATAESYISLFETVYYVAQCTPDIVGSRCERCLRLTLSHMAGCCGTANLGFSTYLPSCMLRYDSAPFLSGSDAPAPDAFDADDPSDILSPAPQPPPKDKSAATSITPIGVGLGFWLLMIAIGLPNNIVVL